MAWGPVIWDADNVVVTSARRFRLGLLHTLVISYGYYYALSSVVNRIAGQRVIGVAPAVRSDPHRCSSRSVGGQVVDLAPPTVVGA